MLAGCAVMPPPDPARRAIATLRRRVFRWLGAHPEAHVAGQRASFAVDRFLRPFWPGAVASLGLCSCPLKVSGANELGEPKGEPTSTGIRPRQATSSHSHGWQMPRRATSSHVQRRYELVLQARGRRFEPCCAHCLSELEMIVREPNGEPKLLMILAMTGLCRASRGTGTPHSSAS
jgi:hypothetical protein